MNRFLCLLTLLFSITFLSVKATALPMPDPGEKRFELMKCTSLKNGTLWASFGRLYRSGVEEVIIFPTEIIVFAKDLNSRLLFPKLDDSLKIKVTYGHGRMSMEFSVPTDTGMRNHVFRLMQYNPSVNNAFVGSWLVTEDGKTEINDEVWCSLD